MRYLLDSDPSEVIEQARYIAQAFGGFHAILKVRAEAQSASDRRELTASLGTLLGAPVTVALTFDFRAKDDFTMNDENHNGQSMSVTISKAYSQLLEAEKALKEAQQSTQFARNRETEAVNRFEKATKAWVKIHESVLESAGMIQRR